MKKIKINKKNIDIKNEDSETEEEENNIIVEEDDIINDIQSESNSDEDSDEDSNEDSDEDSDEDSEVEDSDEDIELENDSDESSVSADDNNDNQIINQEETDIVLNKNVDIGEPKLSNIKYLDNNIIKDLLNKPKITLPLITKFEYSKIKAIRMTQLSNNANPFINTTSSNIEEIADEEIKQMKLPFIIKRNLPNGDYELWKLSELATR